jgi:hypothetical protein
VDTSDDYFRGQHGKKYHIVDKQEDEGFSGGLNETAALSQNDDSKRDALRTAPNDDDDEKEALRRNQRAHLKRKLDKGGQDAAKQHHGATDSYSERNSGHWNLLQSAINTALPDDEGGESLMKRNKM